MKELLLIICLFLMKTKSMIEAESESLLSQKQTSSLVKLKGLLHKKNAYVSLSIFLLVHGCHSTVPSLCQALCQKNTSFFSLTMFNSILENVKSIPSITSSAIIASFITILFNNNYPIIINNNYPVSVHNNYPVPRIIITPKNNSEFYITLVLEKETFQTEPIAIMDVFQDQNQYKAK